MRFTLQHILLSVILLQFAGFAFILWRQPTSTPSSSTATSASSSPPLSSLLGFWNCPPPAAHSPPPSTSFNANAVQAAASARAACTAAEGAATRAASARDDARARLASAHETIQLLRTESENVAHSLRTLVDEKLVAEDLQKRAAWRTLTERVRMRAQSGVGDSGGGGGGGDGDGQCFEVEVRRVLRASDDEMFMARMRYAEAKFNQTASRAVDDAVDKRIAASAAAAHVRTASATASATATAAAASAVVEEHTSLRASSVAQQSSSMSKGLSSLSAASPSSSMGARVCTRYIEGAPSLAADGSGGGRHGLVVVIEALDAVSASARGAQSGALGDGNHGGDDGDWLGDNDGHGARNEVRAHDAAAAAADDKDDASVERQYSRAVVRQACDDSFSVWLVGSTVDDGSGAANDAVWSADAQLAHACHNGVYTFFAAEPPSKRFTLQITRDHVRYEGSDEEYKPGYLPRYYGNELVVSKYYGFDNQVAHNVQPLNTAMVDRSSTCTSSAFSDGHFIHRRRTRISSSGSSATGSSSDDRHAKIPFANGTLSDDAQYDWHSSVCNATRLGADGDVSDVSAISRELSALAKKRFYSITFIGDSISAILHDVFICRNQESNYYNRAVAKDDASAVRNVLRHSCQGTAGHFAVNYIKFNICYAKKGSEAHTDELLNYLAHDYIPSLRSEAAGNKRASAEHILVFNAGLHDVAAVFPASSNSFDLHHSCQVRLAAFFDRHWPGPVIMRHTTAVHRSKCPDPCADTVPYLTNDRVHQWNRKVSAMHALVIPRAHALDAFALTRNSFATSMLPKDVRHFDLPTAVVLTKALVYYIINII